MKPYTEFITRIYTCIVGSFESNGKHVAEVFAEGPDERSYSGSQEYAILKNEYAKLFKSEVQKNLDLFELSGNEFQLEQSKIYPTEVKLLHSCYPKNIRRWLSGTISRKKKCRIEFCVLAWCHSIGWNMVSDDHALKKLRKCQREIAEICKDYICVEQASEPEYSISLLWKASTNAYRRSYRDTSFVLDGSLKIKKKS